MNNHSITPTALRQQMFRSAVALGAMAVTLSLVSSLDHPEGVAATRIESHSIQLESLVSEITAATVTAAATSVVSTETSEADVSTPSAPGKIGDLGRLIAGVVLAPIYIPAIVILTTLYMSGTSVIPIKGFWRDLIIDALKGTLGRIFPRLAEKVSAPAAGTVTASLHKRQPQFGLQSQRRDGSAGTRRTSDSRSGAHHSANRAPSGKAGAGKKPVGSAHRDRQGAGQRSTAQR